MLIDDIIKDLRERGMITLNQRQVVKDSIGFIIEKYKQKEEKLRDDCFLSGFYEGYKSENGIPNEIKQINKNSNNSI